MDHIVVGLSNFAFYQTTSRGLDEFIELCDSPSPSAALFLLSSLSRTRKRVGVARERHTLVT